MVAIRTYAFSVLLLHVLAAVVTSSAAVTDGAARARLALEQQDLKYRKVDAQTYEMLINEDEERRIVELLGPEYLDVGLIGTKVTGPPRHCPVCGKPSEFVDWVFTALARGIHSPEFIVESLKLGTSPKKLGHDVYCSKCGHLTNFRDATGEEGGAPYLGLATPYDRATRTFAENVYKRDLIDDPIMRDSSIKTDFGAVEEVHIKRDEQNPAFWVVGDWLVKRSGPESDAKSPAEDGMRPADDTTAPSPEWIKIWQDKRGGELGKEISESPANAWGPVWVMKRDEPIPSDPGWTTRWLLKRDNRETADPTMAAGLHPSDETPGSDSAQGWVLRASWQTKRDDGTPEPPT